MRGGWRAAPTLTLTLTVTLTRIQVREWCETAGVCGILCTHTCLPYGQVIGPSHSREPSRESRPDAGCGRIAIFNNGAAGMPNFAGERGTGLITRVSADPTPPSDSLYGATAGGLRFDALRIEYDHEAWMALVGKRWPDGSDVHASYHSRMVRGPSSFTIRNAAREGTTLRAKEHTTSRSK